ILVSPNKSEFFIPAELAGERLPLPSVCEGELQSSAKQKHRHRKRHPPTIVLKLQLKVVPPNFSGEYLEHDSGTHDRVLCGYNAKPSHQFHAVCPTSLRGFCHG